jgi:hypothetical protein
MQRRCYEGSASQREKRPAKLEFRLFIDAQGGVRSDTFTGYPRDPQLLECLRQGLDTLRFPAKGETDQLRIGIDLKP